MPEGNVIHYLARTLTEKFGCETVSVTSPQGRFTQAAALVDQTVLQSAQAYGKNLFIDFETQRTIWIHLGLIGKLRIYPLEQIGNPATLRLLISDGKFGAELRGPQWCKLIEADERAAAIAKMGPDPLRADADVELAWKRMHKSVKPIAEVLLDQKIFAGVGNIYRIEVLFRHHIDPQTKANAISRDVFDSIWKDLVKLMTIGTKTGRIDTVADEHSPQAQNRPPRVDAHGGEVYVYRRAGQPCLVCGTPVSADLQANRNLFWCANCQPSGSRGIVLWS